ncbi:unnamed protein product [Closterium sp. NIES-54]
MAAHYQVMHGGALPSHAWRRITKSCMAAHYQVMHGGALPSHAWRRITKSCMAAHYQVMHGGALPSHAWRRITKSCMAVHYQVMHGGSLPSHAWRCITKSCMAVHYQVMHGGSSDSEATGSTESRNVVGDETRAPHCTCYSSTGSWSEFLAPVQPCRQRLLTWRRWARGANGVGGSSGSGGKHGEEGGKGGEGFVKGVCSWGWREVDKLEVAKVRRSEGWSSASLLLAVLMPSRTHSHSHTACPATLLVQAPSQDYLKPITSRYLHALPFPLPFPFPFLPLIPPPNPFRYPSLPTPLEPSADPNRLQRLQALSCPDLRLVPVESTWADCNGWACDVRAQASPQVSSRTMASHRLASPFGMVPRTCRCTAARGAAAVMIALSCAPVSPAPSLVVRLPKPSCYPSNHDAAPFPPSVLSLSDPLPPHSPLNSLPHPSAAHSLLAGFISFSLEDYHV